MAELTFSPGDTIFSEGDPSDVAYMIQSGRVEIVERPSERPVVLAHLGEGFILGEMSLVDERPRSVTARAVDTVRVTTVTRDEFVHMLIHDPEEGMKYVRTLFERLRAMNSQFGALAETATDATTAATRVTLKPRTRQARRSLPREGLTIERFPFRVGRSSLESEEGSLDVNDLYLQDSPPFNVSKNHFSIDRTQEHVVLRDRGSFLGTIVNGVMVGGHRKEAEAVLSDGKNEVIVGGDRSPFYLTVLVEPLDQPLSLDQS